MLERKTYPLASVSNICRCYRSAAAFFLAVTPLMAQAITFSGASDVVYVSDLPNDFVSIRVSGPNDFFLDVADSRIEDPSGVLDDGQYSFEVSAMVDEPIPEISISDTRNGRSQETQRVQPVLVVESGYFRIMNGVVAVSDATEDE